MDHSGRMSLYDIVSSMYHNSSLALNMNCNKAFNNSLTIMCLSKTFLLTFTLCSYVYKTDNRKYHKHIIEL